MKILIFSLGEKGFSVVKALVESSSADLIFCVIGQDNAVVDDFSSTLSNYCKKNGIEHCFRNNTTYNVLDYELFLAIGWRWIIHDVDQNKLIVFHDSLLPKFRGFAPLVTALVKKEKTIGVTALYGAKEYDVGNILLQKKLDVSYPTNIEREIQRISLVYADLAVELLSKLNKAEIDKFGFPQNMIEATYSLWLDEDDYRINWNDDASNIEHFISCVGHPYKGASTILNDSIVRVVKARAREDVKVENRTTGKVIFIESNLPVVVCGKDLLLLEDIRDSNNQTLLPLKSFRSRFR